MQRYKKKVVEFVSTTLNLYIFIIIQLVMDNYEIMNDRRIETKVK